MDKCRASADIAYLASPVTGGGVPVNRFQQLFVMALQQGKKKPEDWAAFVAQILASQGQKIVKDGKVAYLRSESVRTSSYSRPCIAIPIHEKTCQFIGRIW